MTQFPPLRLRDLQPHWRPTFRLAWPVVLGQLGVMLMSLVDTAMVGALGRNAVGAVGLGSSVFGLAFIFGIGLLMDLDHEVSVAYGARREEDLARDAVQGLWLATAISQNGCRRVTSRVRSCPSRPTRVRSQRHQPQLPIIRNVGGRRENVMVGN